jgi:hypothetical protein
VRTDELKYAVLPVFFAQVLHGFLVAMRINTDFLVIFENNAPPARVFHFLAANEVGFVPAPEEIACPHIEVQRLERNIADVFLGFGEMNYAFILITFCEQGIAQVFAVVNIFPFFSHPEIWIFQLFHFYLLSTVELSSFGDVVFEFWYYCTNKNRARLRF